jgi:trehalose 6-phosphate synthase
MGRLVVVSNRVPAPAAPQAGGLAVALDDLLRHRGGLWFGWSGAVAADDAEACPVGLRESGGISFATIDLAATDYQGFYNRFANGVLWPLLHGMPEQIDYQDADAATYQAVNRRFADALLPLLRADDVIWIHDYHLFPLPALLRARGVRNPIGFFLHIPFPPPETLALLPCAGALLRGVLAADLVGVQTEADRRNLAAASARLAPFGRPPAQLGAFPVEIDASAFASLAEAAARTPQTRRLRRGLGSQRLMIGIDRLDPSKGLLQRLRGLRGLLERHPAWRRRCMLLQIAPLSRQEVSSYRALREALECEAGHLNAAFSEADWAPLRLLTQPAGRETLAGLMRLARVGLVTPLRDGMNLVAKEYVAAQNAADPGVLILSRFAGAAGQLSSALLVDPNDTVALSEAMARALAMPRDERRARWQAQWQAIGETSAYGWGSRFLLALRAARAPLARAATVSPPWQSSPAPHALPARQSRGSGVVPVSKGA